MIEEFKFTCSACGAEFEPTKDECYSDTRRRCLEHERKCIAKSVARSKKELYRKFNVEIVECCYNCKHGRRSFTCDSIAINCDALPSHYEIGPKFLKSVHLHPGQVCSQFEIAEEVEE